ncbi:MAG: hypothetical protein Ct9H90mP13_00860 [Pseudomonadota bacterium]|nr:MAG: hypothetical protein Ct9H90mP13_00860 [Pseudomonadota bacterium]
MSPSGTYNANSDGSFFRFASENSAETMEKKYGWSIIKPKRQLS